MKSSSEAGTRREVRQTVLHDLSAIPWTVKGATLRMQVNFVTPRCRSRGGIVAHFAKDKSWDNVRGLRNERLGEQHSHSADR